MLRRAALRSSSSLAGALRRQHVNVTPPTTLLQTRHFFDLPKMRSKEAIAKERARISDELSRGYFADFGEFRQNGGKIAMADKIVIPSSSAVKFPDLDVSFSDGRCLKLPITPSPGESSTDTSAMTMPSVSLVCLSFRASSQEMTKSWILPCLEDFKTAEVQAYEVSFIDSWLLSMSPIRRLLLKTMKKPANPDTQVGYSFGDHYYFRKELQIVNLLTGYIFLLDRSGRVRWRGFGHATDEEVSSLLSCTSILLDEK